MKVQSKVFVRRSDGFTLIEVLMALSVLALLALGAFDVLRAGMLKVDRWSKDVSSDGELRVAMALMARDIRSAYLAAEEQNTYFAGSPHSGPKSDNLDFTRRAMGGESTQDPIWEVGYFLEPGSEPGTWDLCQRWKESIDDKPMEGGTVRHILSGVRSFQLQYFNGSRWSDEWNWDYQRQRPMKGIRGLPLFVRILMNQTNDASATPQQWVVPVMSSVINRALHAA